MGRLWERRDAQSQFWHGVSTASDTPETGAQAPKRRGRDSNPRWTKPPIPVFETGTFGGRNVGFVGGSSSALSLWGRTRGRNAVGGVHTAGVHSEHMPDTKSQRVHLRVAASDDQLFRSAAAAASESLSEFLVESAGAVRVADDRRFRGQPRRRPARSARRGRVPGPSAGGEGAVGGRAAARGLRPAVDRGRADARLGGRWPPSSSPGSSGRSWPPARLIREALPVDARLDAGRRRGAAACRRASGVPVRWAVSPRLTRPAVGGLIRPDGRHARPTSTTA